jgi:dipeptidyl aminopeptidase/acylaminoacyl peptidase
LTILIAAIAASPAHATLVFNKGADTSRATVWAASDDGSGAKRIARGGLNPRISPDGTHVIFQTVYGPPGSRPQLVMVPAGGGTRKVLLDPAWRADTQAWSPDSRYVAAVTGPEIGTQRLVLIDTTDGSVRTVARGAFYGVSFSPTGGAIVYSRARRDDYPPRSSLFVAAVGGGTPTQITKSHPDIYPLWGPQSIVFTRQRKPVRKYDAYKQDLFLIAPGDGAPRQLTHLHPSFLLSGLTPVSWSADGTRLLGQFGGQDTVFAQTVDPVTGRARTVGLERDSIIGAALSRDGSTILATLGAFEDTSQTQIVTVPYAGGKRRVIVRHGWSPDWNR